MSKNNAQRIASNEMEASLPETNQTATPANVEEVTLKMDKSGSKMRLVRPSEKYRMVNTSETAEKVLLLSSATQSLAHAFDLYQEGEGKAKEATEIASKAAFALYQARTTANTSADEVSAKLGDVFGFKANKDGKVSKTPDGQGEAIRKRIVRAVAAFKLVETGETDDGFFAGLSPDSMSEGDDPVSIREVVHNLGTDDGYTINTAYNVFSEIKRAQAVKTDIAFDHKKLSGIVATLGGNGDKSLEDVVAIYKGSQALVIVLDELRRVIGELDDMAGEMEPVEEQHAA